MWTRFKPRFGYGTLIALIAAGLLWWSGALRPPQPATDLRVVYEADSTGKLRRIEPSPSPLPTPPTAKEPRLLLQFADVLQLTPPQRTQIERISADWEQEQAEWLQQLREEQQRVESQMGSRKGEAVPYTALRQSLQRYSELSQAYAQARTIAWERAVSVLSARQREEAEKILDKR
ncbi:MAG: hypothetical protein HPY54_11400 [Chthonomonadetes bacterium]|nr:hypothetical protein [Chthonomonadetes bacterium]